MHVVLPCGRRWGRGWDLNRPRWKVRRIRWDAARLSLCCTKVVVDEDSDAGVEVKSMGMDGYAKIGQRSASVGILAVVGSG